MRISAVHILATYGFASGLAVAQVPANFQWGINGHPLVQEGYRAVPVAVQLDQVEQLGARWYRCDWSQGGLEKDPTGHEALMAEASRRGLRILPVIFPSVSCRSDATPEQIRAASFAFARSLVGRYRGRITHWELDNELDCLTMIRKGEKDRNGRLWEWGDADGNLPEHFEETRYRKARAELLGLHEGVKAADPAAKTIIDTAGWLHYGFIERLAREDKVPFDVLSWHWYSEMGDITRVRNSFNLLEHLRGYGKPIWITEINRRGGSLGEGNEHRQADYLAGAARQLRSLSGVEAMFVYELLDEPYFGPDNPESHYGLVELAKGLDGQWRVSRRKEAYFRLQEVLSHGGAPTSGSTSRPEKHFGVLPEAVRARAALPTSRPAADVKGNPFGTHTTSLAEGHEANRLSDYLKDVADTGYGWVKDYIGAGNVSEGQNWKELWSDFPAHYETYLQTARGLGLSVLLRLDYPRWRGQEPTTPEALEAVGHFYRQVVRRYKPWVADWEIDNEPNIGNEKPRVSPEDYVRIAQIASQAIHAEDPQARVYAPASAMLQCLHDYPFPYVPRLLDAGLLNHINVFSFHPYRQPYTRANIPEHASEFHPWQVWGSYRRQIDDLRSRLRARTGRDVPIAATEVGYPTHTDRATGNREISLATQAKYEQRMMIADFALGLRPRIQFIFKRPWNDPNEVEHNFNLVNADNMKRPAWYAVRNICALFDDTLQPADAGVECDASPEVNPQVFAFIRRDPEFEELRIAVWAGVPADDSRYYTGSCRLTIATDRFRFPVAMDLFQTSPTVLELPCEVAAGRVIVSTVPLHDSPVVVRLFK